MGHLYVLYNQKAGADEDVRLLSLFAEREPIYLDLVSLPDLRAWLEERTAADTVVLCGGDGTLNRFVNATEGVSFPGELLYFPTGTGNDFARDRGHGPLAAPFSLKESLRRLPTVTVKGHAYRFLNGVGYGIDGYCCEVGDALKRRSAKPVNYTAIAVKGLLFHYRPTDACITVDGVTRSYRRVWLAPTMYGRYYGGGMMPTPRQDRDDPEGKLSVMVFHGAGKLRTLCIFPSIFQGTHVKHTRQVEILTGREITVRFNRPAPLQIDGETISDVTEYTAVAAPASADTATHKKGSLTSR